MRLVPIVAAFGFVTLMTAPDLTAATLNAQARLVGCDERDSGGASAFAQCQAQDGNSIARAEFGNIGVLATASGRHGGGHPIWSSTASMSDQLTFGIETGTFVVPIDIAGNISISHTGSRVFGPVPLVDIRLQANDDLIFRDSLTGVVNPDFEYDFVRNQVGNAGVTEFVLSIVDGRADLGLSMYATAFCLGNFYATCAATSDFFSSARILSSRVLDEDGNVVDVSVRADSGFDYLTGVEPHGGDDGGLTPVPVPASLPMLLGGIALLGLRRKMRLSKRRVGRVV